MLAELNTIYTKGHFKNLHDMSQTNTCGKTQAKPACTTSLQTRFPKNFDG